MNVFSCLCVLRCDESPKEGLCEMFCEIVDVVCLKWGFFFLYVVFHEVGSMVTCSFLALTVLGSVTNAGSLLPLWESNFMRSSISVATSDAPPRQEVVLCVPCVDFRSSLPHLTSNLLKVSGCFRRVSSGDRRNMMRVPTLMVRRCMWEMDLRDRDLFMQA